MTNTPFRRWLDAHERSPLRAVLAQLYHRAHLLHQRVCRHAYALVRMTYTVGNDEQRTFQYLRCTRCGHIRGIVRLIEETL